MTLTWHESCGLLGVLLVLLAYLLLQMGRLDGRGLTYQVLNALGALGVMVSLLAGAFNLPAFLLQIAWLAISVLGMVRVMRGRRGGS